MRKRFTLIGVGREFNVEIDCETYPTTDQLAYAARAANAPFGEYAVAKWGDRDVFCTFDFFPQPTTS